MLPALVPTVTIVPRPTRPAAPLQAPRCSSCPYCPWVYCSEVPGPGHPQARDRRPVSLSQCCPRLAAPTSRGGEAEASAAMQLPETGPRKPKFSPASLPSGILHWCQSWPPASAPSPCLFGQQGRFLLGRQRAQTAEILKASYFSSKPISPVLETLELPWNVLDLTLPPLLPLAPPGPTTLVPLTAGETRSFSGWDFARSLIPRPPGAPRKVTFGGSLSNPKVASSQVGQTLPSLNTLPTCSLKQLSCLEQQKKKKNTKQNKKTLSLFGVG